MIRVRRRLMLLLTVTLLLALSMTGCKPVTAPGTAFTAPQGTFALTLPPDFAAVPAAAGGPAAVSSLDMSIAAFDNPKTGERIAVGFITLTGNTEADAMLLPMWLMALPVGDDWQGVALKAVGGSLLADQRYESTRDRGRRQCARGRARQDQRRRPQHGTPTAGPDTRRVGRRQSA